MAFEFKDKMIPKDSNNTLIVDGLNIAFRWKHTLQWNTFRYEFERTIESIANSYNSNKIIIAADWGASSYRKKLYPDYKGDRKDKYKDQTEEDKIKFEEFFEEYEKALELVANRHMVLRYENVEADDIAAHLVKHRKQYELENIWMISSDGDWHLMIQEGVSQFSWRSRKEITVENWSEHYNFPIEKFLSYKVILGDSGDNIPGFAQIGPKRAEALVNQYASALEIHDALPIDSKYKFMDDLNKNPDRILLNYELMSLLDYCDDAIGKENIQDIRGKFDIPW